MLSRFRRFLKKSDGEIVGRELQQMIDYATANMHLQGISADEASAVDESETKNQVHASVESQVGALFRGLAEGEQDSVRHKSSQRYEVETETSFLKQPLVEQHVDAVEERLEESKMFIKQRCGFFTEVKESTVEGAGSGAFVRGNVAAGTVVALYPGKVFMPFQMKRLADAKFRAGHPGSNSPAEKLHEQIFGFPNEPNPYATQRIDGVVLVSNDGSTSTKPNYFACGHMINHPPKGCTPNVVACPFDFRNSFVESQVQTGQDSFKAYIPNKLIKKDEITPSWWWWMMDRELYVPSMVYITSRDLMDGEELFLNYRFNPNLKTPKWYSPVDVAEDARRWTASNV